MIKSIQTYNIVPKSPKIARNLISIANQKQYELRNGIKQGFEQGKRLSIQQNMGTLKSAHAKFIGVKRALPPELWYGFLGALSPLPGGSVLGIGVGILIKALKHKKIKLNRQINIHI